MERDEEDHTVRDSRPLGGRIFRTADQYFSAAPNAHIDAQVDVPFDYPRNLNDAEVANFVHSVHLQLDEAINAHGEKGVDKSA